MVHLYMGDYKTIKNKYCSGYKYVSNITDYLLKHRFGLFNKQKEKLYTIYTKELDAEQLDALHKNNDVIIIIEEIDKKSKFYKFYKKSIKEVSKTTKQQITVRDIYKDIILLSKIKESDRISFLYKIFYDGGRYSYSRAAGETINLVLSGQIQVRDCFRIFLLTIP